MLTVFQKTKEVLPLGFKCKLTIMGLTIFVSMVHSCGKKTESLDRSKNEAAGLPFEWNGLSDYENSVWSFEDVAP